MLVGLLTNPPGLSEKEAAERLVKEGSNELPSARRRTAFAIGLGVVREPMFLLLVAAGAIYLGLGDVQEALMLLGFVLVVMGITFFQERKTERTLEALRDLSSPRALVIRDGQQRRIPGRDVVRDDLLVLAEGDRVPADAVVLDCSGLCVDESLLTGEAIPVRKAAGDEGTAGRPGGDDLPFVYAGTMIVQGRGMAKVTATGPETEIGRIGKALRLLEPEETPLKKETSRLVVWLTIAGLSLCIAVAVLFCATRQDWLGGLLAGIATAMAVLPEEFPVVLTVFLAIGAWRIAKKQVLTRRIAAVEALGAATVLAVDKTGTLTMNRMSLRRVFADGEFFDMEDSKREFPPDNFHSLLEFGILASHRDPFDPTEKAILEFGENYLSRTEHLHANWTLVREYPLSKELLAMSQVWRSPQCSDYVIAAKGAPEFVADLCHLTPTHRQRLMEAVGALAMDGLRVLGVAAALFREERLPAEQHDFEFRFLGLLGLADPVRPGVAAALGQCTAAGIRVVMMTGDYPETALSIARRIGLPVGEIISGEELSRMQESELRQRVKRTSIFARMIPEQKLRLVQALKANGDIVAMTGDGVNDAPALKAAHIGIAMGRRGTDVAREAADLVLLDDDFSSIVQAVRLGRRIYDNLKKAMSYIIAIHVPIAGLALLPVLFHWPLVLLPVHIVFLELIIDPACSIVFEAEPEEGGVMNRPPRAACETLFNRQTLILSVLQGMSVLVIVMAVFGVALYRGHGELEARALTFTTLVIANLGLIFANRSWTRVILRTVRSPNPALWWVSSGALGFLALVLYTPFLRDLFHFARLHLVDLAICLASGIVSIIWFEGMKVFGRVHLE